jgi:hypothetical protein
MMKHHHLLTSAAALSDRDLVAKVGDLAGRERAALVELVAHLAELGHRRCLYEAAGYGSLQAYCMGVLRLSGDAAYNRIEAAKACRRFPVILTLLADGSVSLTAIRLLGRHLTEENHAAVLAEARGRKTLELEAMVARLAPREDLKPGIRRVPEPAPPVEPTPPLPLLAPDRAPSASTLEPSTAPAPPPPVTPRPVMRASAPGRFHVQMTIGQETHDRFRRLQSLLARECRGDQVAVFDLACRALEEKVLKAKRAATTKPRPPRRLETTKPDSRDVPAAVARAVWSRDGERCAFIGPGGVRCPETKFLELHHILPWGLFRTSTPDVLSVRCQPHNRLEAEIVYGRRAIEAHRFRSELGKTTSSAAPPRGTARSPGA